MINSDTLIVVLAVADIIGLIILSIIVSKEEKKVPS